MYAKLSPNYPLYHYNFIEIINKILIQTRLQYTYTSNEYMNKNSKYVIQVWFATKYCYLFFSSLWICFTDTNQTVSMSKNNGNDDVLWIKNIKLFTAFSLSSHTEHTTYTVGYPCKPYIQPNQSRPDPNYTRLSVKALYGF